MKKLAFYIYITFIAIIGIFSSIVLYNYLHNIQKRLQELAFQKETEGFTETVFERIHRNQVLLLGLKSYFTGSIQVTLAEWTTYLDGMNLPKEFPALRFCALAETVAKENLDAFIKNAQSLGIPDYKIWPTSTSNTIMPIVYVSPSYYNKWMGFNLCQDLSNCNALSEIPTEGGITFDATFSFEQDVTKESDITMWLPLKKEGAPARWLLAHLDLALLLEQIISQTGLDHFNIEIYKGSQIAASNLLFSKIPIPITEATLHATHLMPLGNETLTFQLSAHSALTDVQITPSILILSLSLIITALSLAIFYYLEKKRMHLQQALTAVQSSLSQIELLRYLTLDAMTYSIICTDPQGTILIFNKAAENLLGYKAEEMIGKMTPVSFHDLDEMRVRANELTELLGRPISATFEVFVALAAKGIPDERHWKYIRKDKSVVEVNLIVSPLKDSAANLLGYMGVARKL